MPNEFPRRIQMEKWTPAERAIYDAVQLVEQMGADVRLTDAVILLSRAREAVADFVDGAPRREPTDVWANVEKAATSVPEWVFKAPQQGTPTAPPPERAP